VVVALNPTHTDLMEAAEDLLADNPRLSNDQSRADYLVWLYRELETRVTRIKLAKANQKIKEAKKRFELELQRSVDEQGRRIQTAATVDTFMREYNESHDINHGTGDTIRLKNPAKIIFTDPINDVEQIEVGEHNIQFGGPAGDGYCYAHQSFECLGNLTPEEKSAIDNVERNNHV
jgi:hypothetical protein